MPLCSADTTNRLQAGRLSAAVSCSRLAKQSLQRMSHVIQVCNSGPAQVTDSAAVLTTRPLVSKHSLKSLLGDARQAPSCRTCPCFRIALAGAASGTGAGEGDAGAGRGDGEGLGLARTAGLGDGDGRRAGVVRRGLGVGCVSGAGGGSVLACGRGCGTAVTGSGVGSTSTSGSGSGTAAAGCGVVPTGMTLGPNCPM